MVTLAQARDNIGAFVIYRAEGRREEMGQIISVKAPWIFVRYDGRPRQQATLPDYLHWHSIPRSEP